MNERLHDYTDRQIYASPKLTICSIVKWCGQCSVHDIDLSPILNQQTHNLCMASCTHTHTHTHTRTHTHTHTHLLKNNLDIIQWIARLCYRCPSRVRTIKPFRHYVRKSVHVTRDSWD